MNRNGKAYFNLNLSSLEIATPEKRSESGNGSGLKEGIVILQPIAMRIPNSHGVYSPSKLRPKKEVSYEEFLQQYARYSRKIRVCFNETPSSDTLLLQSELITAYGFGWSGWYIIDLSKEALN